MEECPSQCCLDYNWFNTGHIHQFSIKDFEYLVSDIGGLKIVAQNFIKNKNHFKDYFAKTFPNLFMQFPIYSLKKMEYQ